ncbi:MAG: glycosyltransferase [Acidobacteria bacterium]|nr:MAG: glycosyltransferase [Acidobacteriota bacterium]
MNDSRHGAIRVAALTSGRDVPSARFRVRQHLGRLEALGVGVQEYPLAIDKHSRPIGWPKSLRPALAGPFFLVWQLFKVGLRVPGLLASHRVDVTWIEREFLPGALTLEPLAGRPMVFDVDDAIWLGSPAGRSAARYLGRRASVVVAGNAFLGEWFREIGAARVEVVPTGVDSTVYEPRIGGMRSGHFDFTIGWIGTPANLRYLERLEGPLASFLSQRPTARLLVVCSEPPRMRSIAPSQLQFRAWVAEEEPDVISRMDLGLMPLPDTEWSRGKCAFKMLQYMSCGVPVLVSPFGMNGEVLGLGRVGLPATEDAEWRRALDWFADHPAEAREMGRCGRDVVRSHFDSADIAARLGDVLRWASRQGGPQ